jgi:hypothetical protein
VNAELRRLLVASMGDDLQEHLRSLSEDKASLACSIEHYARIHGKHMENVDDLIIETDLWRSKFLASRCAPLVVLYVVILFYHFQCNDR